MYCNSYVIRGVAQPGSASGLGPEGRRFKSYRPDHFMKKKAKIYKPTKSSMQSGLMKTKEWILEYIVHNEQTNPLMGWQSSSNTLSEVKMTFNSKEDAIDYAKKNKINYIVVEPNKRSIVKKSYADNFLK